MKSLIDPVEFAALLESGRTYKTCEVRDMIDAVPRIKIAPPAGAQARWELIGPLHHCSNPKCGFAALCDGREEELSDFCPHCGAVMNATSEEQEAATRTEAEVTNIRISEALQELESAYLEYDLDYAFYIRMHDFISRIGVTEPEAEDEQAD
jgi:hypothetical protein